MPSLFLTAALVGMALLHGAEPGADAPVTTEAVPAETPVAPATPPAETTPLPDMDLPAQTVQGDPAPPQGSAAPQSEPEAQPEAAPAAPAEGDKAAATGEATATEPPSPEMIRPTENKDRSGKKVVAFWFITTGK